jgi:hypothetical protein
MEQNPHSVSNTRNTNGNGHASLALVPLSDMQQMAKIGVESNFFGIKKPTEAMALMLIAQAEGKHPATVFSQYHVIQGRPALKADAMLARFQQAGGSVQWTERTDKSCAATFAHPQGGKCDIRWTLDDAKRAGLLNGKSNWNQYPRQMLSARVVSEGVRAVFPGVLGGFYTPEEVGQFEPVAAAPVAYSRPEPQTPVLTDEADVIDVVAEKTSEQMFNEDPVTGTGNSSWSLSKPKAAPVRKKQPVAAMDEGADWQTARFIKGNSQDKTSKAGKAYKQWGVFVEIDGAEKAEWLNTIDRDLGATVDALAPGENVLLQVKVDDYGRKLGAIRTADVPTKHEQAAPAEEMADSDIPL